MNKPNNYDTTVAYGSFPKLELGGHIMTIAKIEETVSSSGNEMIKIYLDTDKTDKQPEFFKKRYAANTRKEKKWGCVVPQLTTDPKTDDANSGFKAFITSVEESNEGFKVVWGDKFCDCFKGRKVGAVFGREQFLNHQDKLLWGTKLFWFRSVKAIRDGVEIPEDRPYKPKEGEPVPVGANVVVNIETGEVTTEYTDDDYPF